MQTQKEVQDKILQYQQIQQQTRILLSQKQNIEIKISEIDEALSEINQCKEDDAIYRTYGSVMVKVKNKDEVIKEMNEEKEVLGVRLKTLDKQINRLKDRLKELQNEISSAVQSVG